MAAFRVVLFLGFILLTTAKLSSEIRKHYYALGASEGDTINEIKRKHRMKSSMYNVDNVRQGMRGGELDENKEISIEAKKAVVDVALSEILAYQSQLHCSPEFEELITTLETWWGDVDEIESRAWLVKLERYTRTYSGHIVQDFRVLLDRILFYNRLTVNERYMMNLFGFMVQVTLFLAASGVLFWVFVMCRLCVWSWQLLDQAEVAKQKVYDVKSV